MPAATPPQLELTRLNQEIERLEGELTLLKEQRKKRCSAARWAIWRRNYLLVARALRRPATKWDWWPIGALALGPVFVGIICFVLVNVLTSWASLALVAFFLSATVAVAVIASLLFRPRNDRLSAAIDEAEEHVKLASAHWKEASERTHEVKQQLTRLVEDRRQRMASGRVQRAALLQRHWKTMPAGEWEDYVVEVCRTLGATVDRRSRGEEGEELIVEFGPHTVATLIKTSEETIHSGAVQYVLVMKDRERCESCAIISQGRFTGAAQDYAQRNGCQLVGRDEFPDFVLGRVTL